MLPVPLCKPCCGTSIIYVAGAMLVLRNVLWVGPWGRCQPRGRSSHAGVSHDSEDEVFAILASEPRPFWSIGCIYMIYSCFLSQMCWNPFISRIRIASCIHWWCWEENVETGWRTGLKQLSYFDITAVVYPGAVDCNPWHGACWEVSVAAFMYCSWLLQYQVITLSNPGTFEDGVGTESKKRWTWRSLQKVAGSPKVILCCWCPIQAWYYDWPFKLSTGFEVLDVMLTCFSFFQTCLAPASSDKKTLANLLVECTQADVACNYLLARTRLTGYDSQLVFFCIQDLLKSPWYRSRNIGPSGPSKSRRPRQLRLLRNQLHAKHCVIGRNAMQMQMQSLRPLSQLSHQKRRVRKRRLRRMKSLLKFPPKSERRLRSRLCQFFWDAPDHGCVLILKPNNMIKKIHLNILWMWALRHILMNRQSAWRVDLCWKHQTSETPDQRRKTYCVRAWFSLRPSTCIFYQSVN